MAEWNTATSQDSDIRPTEESLLLDHLNRIRSSRSEHFAIHIHLSAFRPNDKQPHFIDIASRTCADLIDHSTTTLYSLNNKDLVLVCHGVPIDHVDAVVEKVRGLFSEDPLTEIDETTVKDRFSTWFDLSNAEDFADFFSFATAWAVETEQKLQKMELLRDQEEQQGKPLRASNLADINRKLAGMRVADTIKRQACLQVTGGGSLVFYELLISMNDVRDRVATGINLFASPWLLQYLTETLDQRLLAVLLEKKFDELCDPLSINLNISTVLSQDFQNLVQAVDDNTDKVIVEFQINDIFADLKSYAYARDFLQERGYRIVADGLNPLSLQYFELASLKSDFIKISCGQEFTSNKDDRRVEEIREAIATAGKDSIIFSHVLSEKTLKWGVGLGVSCFQGFFIDKLVQIIGSGKRVPTAG